MASRIVEVLFGDPTARPLCVPGSDESPIALMFCASAFDTVEAFENHLRLHGGNLEMAIQSLPGLFEVNSQRWDQYCDEVERSVRGEDVPTTSVFGACKRCKGRSFLHEGACFRVPVCWSPPVNFDAPMRV